MQIRPRAPLAEPPEGGTIELRFPFGPISLQADPDRKKALRAQIADHLPGYEFLLSGDVSVEIIWMIHERARYESAFTTDIDNILKPLLDAISGANGIMINDTQVQHIACSWIDWESTDQRIDVTLKYERDEFVRKHGLVFLRMPDSSLCFPYNDEVPRQFAERYLELLEGMWSLRTRLIGDMGDHSIARYAMPIQRCFHVAHLREYKIVPFSEMKAHLESSRTHPKSPHPASSTEPSTGST